MKKLILLLIPLLIISCEKSVVILEPKKTENNEDLSNKRNSATVWDTDNIRFCYNEENISNSNYVGKAFQRTYGVGGIIGTFEYKGASYSFYENGEYEFEYNDDIYTGNFHLGLVSSYQTITISGNRQFYYVDGDYLILSGNILEDLQYIENPIIAYVLKSKIG